MGLSWQQGPLGERRTGTFLAPDPLPARLPYAEPLRRRMRAVFAGQTLIDTDDIVVVHEPGRYPVAWFPQDAFTPGALTETERLTPHPDFGLQRWYDVSLGGRTAVRAAWRLADPRPHTEILAGRVALAWAAMDAFFEEDERIFGHAADDYHRVDVRRSSRHLVVRHAGAVLAESRAPVVLYESGFAPRWYVPESDVNGDLVVANDHRTFCPYKDTASWVDVVVPGSAVVVNAGWAYRTPYPEVAGIAGHLSFYPNLLDVSIDGRPLTEAGGQAVLAHGRDRDLTIPVTR